MRERIVKLLYRHFEIKDGKVYLVENNQLVTHFQIERTIREIFGTPVYFNRYIIECWYISNGLEVCTHFWGKPWQLWSFDFKTPDGFPSIMPIAQRIAAQTIGMDLVAVQPLSAPTGLLMHMDFQYDTDIVPNERIRMGDIRVENDAYVQDITVEHIKPPIKRWEESGLLEGLKGPMKENLSLLLESQVRQILRENEGDERLLR